MNFQEICVENNISPSYTRMRVFDYLASKSHPTVDEIYQSLKPELPTLSKTSVYNILKLFIQKGLVTTVNVNSGDSRFELAMDNHSHFKCNHCGEIFDIPYIKPKWDKTSLEGFEIETHEVTLKGLCKDCREKSVQS